MDTRQLSPHTGCEVRGIDLTAGVDQQCARTLNELFLRHSVLVIRGQRLTPQDLLGAVQLFGDVFEQHNARFALPDCPQIHYLSNEDHFADGRRYIPGSGYHTDHSNDRVPPKATVLHAVELPSTGGDTQYCNMHAAYEALDEATRRRIDPLQAVHVYQSRHSARKLMPLDPRRASQVPEAVVHPLVRVHPQTGRKALYLNPIRIERIEGLSDDEALPLLDELLRHATQPRFEYRHRWQVGDLVIWDNRCLLHKANGDYDMSERRYLYRVMLRDESADAAQRKAG